MKRTVIAVACLPVLVGLGACTNPKDASKDNFARLVTTQLADEPVCYVVQPSVQVDKSYPGDQFAARAYGELAKFGLYTAKDVKMQPHGFHFGRTSQVDGVQYDMTGQAKLLEFPLRQGDNAKLCLAKKALVSVESFTPPADVNGYTVSRVAYRYRFAGAPDWARTPQAKDAIENAMGFVHQNYEIDGAEHGAEMTMVLTNDGWITEAQYSARTRKG